jgi:hypothetical protein
MAEYSKEYFVLNDVPEFEFDFSYKVQFEYLKNGQTFYSICEGLGIIGISKIENEPFYVLIDNVQIAVDLFKDYYFEKK